MANNKLLVILVGWTCILFISVTAVPTSYKDGLKTLVRMSRQIDEEEPATVSAIATGPPPTSPGNQACTPDQCNNKGTCFGTRAMPFCFCQLGYAGSQCQDRYCDSNRDCNARGWCMGTDTQFTCLCNLGFSGTRCELQTVSSSAVMSTPSPFATTTTSRPHIVDDSEHEHLDEPTDEQI